MKKKKPIRKGAKRMGGTKDNLKPTNNDSKNVFSKALDLVKSKSTGKDAKTTAKTYVDQLVDLEKSLTEMIIAKERDVQNEPSRDYNKRVLAELNIQLTMVNQMIESAARCAQYGEDEKH